MLALLAMLAAQAFVLPLGHSTPVTLATARTTRLLAYVDPFADPVFNQAANTAVAQHETISAASTVASRNILVRTLDSLLCLAHTRTCTRKHTCV